GPAHWAMLPSTLEWHAAAALLALAALFWGPALLGAAALLALSLLVAVLQAAQARLAPEHDGLTSRLLVAALCYAQPLVRSWKRLLRVRYRLRAGGYVKALAWTGALVVPCAVILNVYGAAVGALGLLALAAGLWGRGSRRASRAMALVDAVARDMGLIPCDPA